MLWNKQRMEKVAQKNCQIFLWKPARYAIATSDKMSRKEQILHTLAQMLAGSPGERVTTARLAVKVGVSEAALYRHFPSKAKMFEGLIALIEETLFTHSAKILSEEHEASVICQRILTTLILFCEQNPGLARILTGDALNGETERLHTRVFQLLEKLENQIQSVIQTHQSPSVPPAVAANMLLAFAEGRINQFVRSQFRRKPSQHWQEQWQAISRTVFC